MNETAKAMRRRFVEHETKVFPWMDIFKGRGIDVGCGPDKLPFDDCRGFDLADGDANSLSSHFPPETFDYLHSSQSLEHMRDPWIALDDWLKVVKKGGYIVVSVPDWGLYEGFRFPSIYNPDHKSTFSLCYRRSPCEQHIFVPDFLHAFAKAAECKLVRVVDSNYDFTVMTTRDQTYDECDGVEAWIEFVLVKL